MNSFYTIRNKQDTSGILGEVNKAEINAIVFIQSLPNIKKEPWRLIQHLEII